MKNMWYKSTVQAFGSDLPASNLFSSMVSATGQAASPAKASTSLSSPMKSTSSPSTLTKQVMIAYVHHLSPLQRNQKDMMYYSTVILQASDHCQEAFVYSKQRRKLQEDSQQFHTPLKIQKLTFTLDSEKLIIKDMTHLSMPFPHEYAFQYEATEQHVLPIADIRELKQPRPKGRGRRQVIVKGLERGRRF